MAELHNQLFRGIWSDAIKRILGVTKAPGGLERFGETLTPIINLWDQPDWSFLRKERLCGARRVVAAGGAATFAMAALVNTTMNLIITLVNVSHILAGAGSQADVYMVLETDVNPTLGASQNGFIRDTRWDPLRTSLAVIRYGTPAAVPAGARGPIEQSSNTATNESVPFRTCLPIIIHPGSGVLVAHQTANQQAIVSFGWKERLALPGELP